MAEDMAAVAGPLTFQEFALLYQSSERPYEFWHGALVEKSMATWLHSLLQVILSEALRRAGYKAATELDLRLDPEFAPRPDVAAGRQSIPTPYPTEPGQIEIVIEILSPDDAMTRVLAKCEEYVRIGIEQVYLADPQAESAWIWNRERRQLDRLEEFKLTNGATISLAEVWRELRERK